jgi:8-oxo-dGTP diphosphatase
MTDQACAAIIEKDSRVLVTQRKANQTFPLKWELPGGHVERNETRQACLRREINEELGVHIAALRPYCTRKYETGGNRLTIYYYRCRIASGRPRKLEVRNFRWIEPARHTIYDFISTDRSVLRKLSKP